jgi:YD repeat-containing protein
MFRSGSLPDFVTTHVCHITYERDAAGRVIVTKYVNRENQLVYEEHIDHDHQEIAYKDAAGRWRPLTDSGAAQVRFTWYNTTGPHEGLLYETRYIDRDQKPQPDALGLYGTRSAYDARGFLAQATWLGADETPTAVQAFRAAIMTFTRDDQGRQTESAAFDAQGHMLDETYLGPDGQPMLRYNRYARVTFTYDQAGRLREATLWDLADQRLPPAQVTIIEVPPDSQGARYQLRQGDIIERYHGRAVPNSFSLDMQAHTPGEGRRALQIRRGNDVELLQVDPGDLGVRLQDVWPPGAP